jgi:hypothetical protein
MGIAAEFSSENARHVILRHEDKLYYVSRVSVNFCEGEKTHRATFHARRALDNGSEDLDLEITRKLYDVLVGYARLDSYDQILILQIDGRDSRWCLISENWFKQRGSGNRPNKYII